jgi:O-antigen ligase
VAARRLASTSPGAVALAAAIPVLFLHVVYQPGFGVSAGSTTVHAYLSDFAVLAVVIAALSSGLRHGFGPLRPGRALWIAGAAFLVWMLVEVALGHAHSASYAWRTHGVTAAKFAEYALLAPAVPLLIRRARDLVLPLWSLVSWSACATAVGIAQFFGARILLHGNTGHRQASFLSFSDFAALSGAVLLVGVVALAVPRLRLGGRLAALAIASGTLGTILAGAIASVIGVATALVALGVVLLLRRELAPHRVAAVAAVAAVVVLGAVAIRGNDLGAFARFVGGKQTTEQSTDIQTYSHRTLLAWLGLEIWKDNPVLGVGWEGTVEPANFVPYLPAAHRRFPDLAPEAFPSAAPERRYGVQNVWVEALADLGVVGLLLWGAVFASAAWVATRSARAPALLGLAWTALVAWVWAGQSFIAGIPLDALTWLAFGLAATRTANDA